MHTYTLTSGIHTIGVAKVSQLIDSNMKQDQPVDHKLWSIIEYVPGSTLDEFFKQQRQAAVSLQEALAISRQLLAIVKTVQAKDIVHRDIKPDNILVTGNEQNIQSVLIDFGMSYSRGNELFDNDDEVSDENENETDVGDQLGNHFYKPFQLFVQLHVKDKTKFTETRRSRTIDTSEIVAILFWLITGERPKSNKDDSGQAPQDRPRSKIRIQQSIQNTVTDGKIAILETM